jgi:hypothetical protein
MNGFSKMVRSEKTKKMGPISAYFKPFENGSPSKMKSQNLRMRMETDFSILPVQFFIAYL